MARLDELLAGWLLKRLSRRRTDRDTNPSPLPAETAALAELAKSQMEMSCRLKDTAEKRQVIFKALKKRLLQTKQELRDLKQRIREAESESWRWKREALKAREEIEGLSAVVADVLERPGLTPLGSSRDDQRHKLLLRHGRTIWKHPMRLGVLRQHEPVPREDERFPRLTPPGPPETWPSVSIVTPSFQQAAFLERTMLSVLQQDYPRLEYHVADGGSEDGSVEIIQKHASKLASWLSEKDTGPASAINKGFAKARGDIMAWLNSDDMLQPGAVKFVAAYLARHPEVDAVYGHRLILDERDWQVGRWVMPRHDAAALLWADYVPQETLFWRRSMWEKIGAGLDENFKFAFDWDLLLRFQKAGGRIARLPWFLGCFRVHDAQKSSADINTIGRAEVGRLRERELAGMFSKERLSRHMVHMQHRAIWCDRLLRWGVRW